jgi:hypothetical protein
MFTSHFQGETLILLNYKVNGSLQKRLEGFCSTIELHPRRADARTPQYRICAASKKARASSRPTPAAGEPRALGRFG